jgi:hypothetical protein
MMTTFFLAQMSKSRDAKPNRGQKPLIFSPHRLVSPAITVGGKPFYSESARAMLDMVGNAVMVVVMGIDTISLQKGKVRESLAFFVEQFLGKRQYILH